MNNESPSTFELKLTSLYATGPRPEFVQSLEKRLLTSPEKNTPTWQWWLRDLRQSRRTRLAWATAVLVFLVAGVAATPQGRSLAQTVVRSFLGYFSVTDKTSLPLPATPAALPTYMIQPKLVPFSPKSTPAADISQCGASVSELTSSPYCLMLNAQAEAGFEVKAFGTSDVPLQYDGVGQFIDGSVLIWYWNPQEDEVYCFAQGVGSEFKSCRPNTSVPTESVQEVIVGNHPAELVAGDYSSNWTTTNWSPNTPAAELRWREGGHWYAIFVFRTTWPMDSASKKAILAELRQRLIHFGESIVPLSAGGGNMAGGVDQTPEQRLGFHILLPAALPRGYELTGVSLSNWSPALKGTVMVSFNQVDHGNYAGNGLSLLEGPAANPYLDLATYFIDPSLWPPVKLSMDEAVQIGNFSGRYMVKPDGRAALVWEQDGVKLMLSPNYDETTFGGRFTKAELIAIAESIK